MSPGASRLARTVLAVVLAPLIALMVAAALTPLPAELTSAGSASDSVRFTDRDGRLLREVRADDGMRARWVLLDEIGELPQKALLAAEDARFYEHPGVDPLAILRASLSNAAAMRVVSGASTISMQVARLVRPHRRNLRGKLAEMALAVRLSVSLSKHQVLEQYINRAPFGAQVRGFDAASRYYFDKPSRSLSLAEAATLAAIPRGPFVYSLTKHPSRVLRRRDRILGRMLESRWITRDAYDRAISEPLHLHLAGGTFGAPHMIQALRASGSIDGALEVTTTLSHDLQREAEASARNLLQPLTKRNVTAASVVVLDNARGEVLAYVGSQDFNDAAHGGQNDGVRAHRQPGSTLKPFVYGLAMERLGFTAATVVPDIELRLAVTGGEYAPRNYDERFHGPVRLREALGNSLNVPAVWTANEIGEGPLLERLLDLGFASLARSPEYYGPGLALGDGEVTLLELANAYATIARGGLVKEVTFIRSTRRAGLPPAAPLQRAPVRVMPRHVAAIITDILKDKNARIASFGERSALELPFDVAVKTGTSKGFRDNWTVGFTREVTVAVWVGNFDGSPMEGVSGVTGAAPLFRAVMETAMRDRTRLPMGIDPADDDLIETRVCPLSGKRPGPACGHAVHEWLPRSRALEAQDTCTMHEIVAVDVRNGLRASSTCSRDVVEARSYERFEGRFAEWAHGARRATAPSAYSALCAGSEAPAVRSGGGARIGYPRDGARFLISPDRPRASQTIAVRLEAPAAPPLVVLRIDGQVAASVASPYVVRWSLLPGEHVLVAEAPGLGASERVRIRVD